MVTRKTHPIILIINRRLIDLPSPSNISYMWNFGSLLGGCLAVQIMRGFFLAIHFSGDTSLSFQRVSHIGRDVEYGWLIRAIHANGASIFFFVIYLHIGRGIYYSSFHFGAVWGTGVIILLALIGTAFLGYVLPWGQISFWGATVITNLVRAIPYIGDLLTVWIWGGFSVDNATLTRFYSLHFVLPFVLGVLIVVHILFLHETGSSNPLGTPLSLDKVPFHPYFSWRDVWGMLVLGIFFITTVLLAPYGLRDPENFIPANPLVTPPHIQPEWYFLFAYAILRSIPNKLGGVVGLFLSIVVLLALPLSIKNAFNPTYMCPAAKAIFWCLVNIFFILTYLGACPVEEPYVFVGQIATVLYFSYYLALPLVRHNS